MYNFLTDIFPSKELNGKFLHVRDDIKSINFDNKEELFNTKILLSPCGEGQGVRLCLNYQNMFSTISSEAK